MNLRLLNRKGYYKMTKEFNSLDEIQKYYNEETSTYIFKENDEYIDLVIFNFNLEVN